MDNENIAGEYPNSPEPTEKKFKLIDEEKIKSEASYFKAYFLWLFLGWTGLHRFYLGRWFSGILYFCSLGIFFMGWILDLFLIPYMIKSRRSKLRELQREIPEDFIPEKAEVAPWSKTKDFLFYLEFPMQALFFVVTPALFVALAVMVNKYELIIIFTVILLASSSINFVHSIMKRNPAIGRIPALGEALDTFKDLHKYYYENKPRNFIFYLLYFFVGFPMMLLSPSLRREFKLYSKIILSIFLITIIEAIFSYNSTYPPHLSASDAVVILAIEIIIVSIGIVSFMMPTVTTSFSLSLRGKKNTLQVLTFFAFIFCIPIGIMVFQLEKDSASIVDMQLMNARLTKDSFQQELETSSKMFLEYYIKRLPKEEIADIKSLPELTTKYHRHIGGLMTEKEVFLFQVITFSYMERTMFGVLYHNSNNIRLLYIIDEQQQTHEWESLPESTQNTISEFSKISNSAKNKNTSER